MDWASIGIVIFVWLLIFCLAISYFCLFLPALYIENVAMFYVLTVASTVTIVIGCISYFKAIWTAPGYPNQSLKFQYSAQLDDMKSRLEQQKQFKRLRKDKKLSSDIKRRQVENLVMDSYCQKCDNVKLSRVHHCKICGRCIERMDHHCPWVGNCVGKHNHKYFILFLLYISIALIIVSMSILADYISGQTILNHIFQIDEIYYYIVLMNGAMCIMLFIAIGFLLISQLMMLFSNITTLESFYDGIQVFNPFDTNSITQNIKEVTGQSIWLFPTKPFASENQINVAFH